MRLSAIERALQLAREGPFDKVEHIARQLVREGHSDANSQLQGTSIRKQIRGIIKGRTASSVSTAAKSEMPAAR